MTNLFKWVSGLFRNDSVPDLKKPLHQEDMITQKMRNLVVLLDRANEGAYSVEDVLESYQSNPASFDNLISTERFLNHLIYRVSLEPCPARDVCLGLLARMPDEIVSAKCQFFIALYDYYGVDSGHNELEHVLVAGQRNARAREVLDGLLCRSDVKTIDQNIPSLLRIIVDKEKPSRIFPDFPSWYISDPDRSFCKDTTREITVKLLSRATNEGIIGCLPLLKKYIDSDSTDIHIVNELIAKVSTHVPKNDIRRLIT